MPVNAAPGASAALAALAVAGLPTDRFFFEGFLPPKDGQRRSRIAELGRIPATLILYESGPRHRRARSHALAEGLGARQAAVCRELTKLHEEVRRGDLAALAQAYDDAERRDPRRVHHRHRAARRRRRRRRRRRGRRAAAARAAARLGEGRGQRRRGRHRPAAARNLSARAGAQRRRRWRRATMARRMCRPRTPRPERVAAHFAGLSAESRAAAYLVAKGYRIVARRFRSPVGEVDIVARRRGVLVFVEVKARNTLDGAAVVAAAAPAAADRRRGRSLARRASRGWRKRHPVRRGAGRAGKNPAPHPGGVRDGVDVVL